MIASVAEFIHLVRSDEAADRKRSAWEQAPVDVWLDVVRDHPDMRVWAANNRTIPVEVMQILARDSDWRVRGRLASKAACPPEILLLLAGDEHETVASTVAGHPNTPVGALRHLALHPWDQVGEKAIRQLSKRGELPPAAGSD